MTQAGGMVAGAGGAGVKMIVVSSSQLAQTTSKPITISMPGTQKTVTLSASGKGGQIVQTSSGQILQLPAGGLMSGGKPVTVQMASGGHKTLTLVQAPPKNETENETDEAATAAESILKDADENPPQVDGGIQTPPNELEDISEFGVFFSQVDGNNDEETEESKTETEETKNEASAEEVKTEESEAKAAEDEDKAEEENKEETSEIDVKDENLEEPEKTENIPEKTDNVEKAEKPVAKDPLAEAMNEVTGGNDEASEKIDDSDMDGASALAALASAAVNSNNENQPPNNGTVKKSSSTEKRDANWFDVGIIKGSSCTVSSYYLPSGDLERSEIDIEGDYFSF